MAVEIGQLAGAEPHERADGQANRRNGYRERRFNTMHLKVREAERVVFNTVVVAYWLNSDAHKGQKKAISTRADRRELAAMHRALRHNVQEKVTK